MRTILTIFASLVLLSAPAIARDERPVYVPSEGTTLRELPGNAYIVEDKDDNGPVVIINNGYSPLYRALITPRPKDPVYLYQSAPYGAVVNTCGNTGTISERNRCVKGLIRERERALRRYND
jgi:hypothetical protein